MEGAAWTARGWHERDQTATSMNKPSAMQDGRLAYIACARRLRVLLFYFSQTRGRMLKPDSRVMERANGQTGPSGGTAAFQG